MKEKNLMNRSRDYDLIYKIKQIISKMIGDLVSTNSIQNQIVKDRSFDIPFQRKFRSILKNVQNELQKS